MAIIPAEQNSQGTKMGTTLKTILAAASLLLSVASGFCLKSGGRPHNPLLFNLHKFSSLAFVILAVWLFHTIDYNSGPRTLRLTLMFISCASCLALFISGGMMSLTKPAAAYIRTIHRITMVITPAAMIVLLLIIHKG